MILQARGIKTRALLEKGSEIADIDTAKAEVLGFGGLSAKASNLGG